MSIIGNAMTFGGGSGAPELLWTNPSPSASFSPQTVTVATGYSAYLIEFRRYINNDIYSVLCVPLSDSRRNAVCHLFWSFPIQNLNYYRRINSATDGAIVFDHCYQHGGGRNNAFHIPTRIWGVKWTI